MARASRPDSFGRDLLHLLILSSFAIAEPLLEVLKRNPEFLVAHRLAPADLVALPVLLALVPAAALGLLVLAARMAGRTAARVTCAAAVSVLVALVGLQVARRLGGWPSPAAFGFSALAAGVAGALYYRSVATRTFVTWLWPGLLLFPAAFLLAGPVRPFVVPHDRTRGVEAPKPPDTPIVMVLFDQFPLASLLDGQGRINAARYPAFAALASDATWYRRDTTAADLTGWAIPAIVTGSFPHSDRSPTAQEYPHNLFALLGPSYTFDVVEPITKLCPERLCGSDREAVAVRYAGTLADLGVVYLHMVLPADLEHRLPSLTENWRDFFTASNWKTRWVHARDEDRRANALAFIQSIDGHRPARTLYFLHVLLPHEPYVYLPSGQELDDDAALTGLRPDGRWTVNQWLVVQTYRRHLLQAGYTDRLLGQLVARLKEVGLYDRALLVVTADHGVSFDPGEPFKGVNVAHGAGDPAGAAVHQGPGAARGRRERPERRVDRHPPDDGRPARRAADVDAGWRVGGGAGRAGAQGQSGLLRRRPAPVRGRARRAASAAGRCGEAQDRLVRPGQRGPPSAGGPARRADRPPARRPAPGAAGEGPRGHARRSRRDSRTLIVDAPLFPARLNGRVTSVHPIEHVPLAVAINGTIRATTWAEVPEGYVLRLWTALVTPHWFKAGANDIEVFVVDDGNPPVLHPAMRAAGRPAGINLILPISRDTWGVEQHGLYALEPLDADRSFCWTDGAATVTTSIDPRRPPRSLRVGLDGTGPQGASLTVRLDGCVLFDGRLPPGPWYRTFALDRCPPSGDRATVTLTSSTFVPGGGDDRTLGVGVVALNLVTFPWPLAPADLPAESPEYRLTFGGDTRETVTPTEARLALLRVANDGDRPWPSAADPGDPENAVGVVVRWSRAGGKGAPVAEVLVSLPRAIYPGDVAVVPVPLLPPAVTLAPGDYDLRVGLRQGAHGEFPPPESPPQLRVTVQR